MDPLIEFTIPIRGLGDGIHRFEYHIEAPFFRQFESSPVQEGNIQLQLELDKKPSLIELHFEFSGTVRTNCDRCLAVIDLPIAGSERVLVKLTPETDNTDPEVLFLAPDEDKLELAALVYEFIVLAIPMIKVFDCESIDPPVCDQEMLDRLEQAEEETEPEENPIWEALKNFNQNN